MLLLRALYITLKKLITFLYTGFADPYIVLLYESGIFTIEGTLAEHCHSQAL